MRPGSHRALSLSWRASDRPVRRLLPAATSGALAASCGIGLLATSGWLITRASERPHVFALSIAIGMVQAFALLRGVARYLQRLSVHGAALDVLGKLRLNLYDVLEPLVPGGMKTTTPGSVLTGFVSDTELVTEGFAKEITASVDVTFSIVVGAAVACLVEPDLGALLVVVALLVVAVAVACSRVGRAEAASQAVAREELASTVLETMRSARELVACGREDLVVDRLDEVRRRSTAAAGRRALGTGLGRLGVTLASGAGLIAVVAAGLGAHDAHRLSGLMLAVVIFVALAVFDQCANVPVVLADARTADAAAGRLCQLAELDAPVRETEVDRSPAAGPITAVLDDAEVVSEGTAILSGLSLEVAPGGRVALVGRSGAGKTSALHALLHFVACSAGRASLGGVDVEEMTRLGIARHVGWMAEETHVFGASLGDNLRVARPSAEDDECVAVLSRVGLLVWWRSLPDGLATMLGPGGRPLSAGERQRLGMARALLGGGKVLLLDEPTSHLDPASSEQVLSELLDSAGSRSVLVVTHEPDIGRHVDRVMTVEAGRVVGSASYP